MIESDVRSYYEATAHRTTVRPRLEGGHKADVCVIGGGFTGLSAALHLARAGASVTLLEGYRVGFGASGRNGGQAITGYRKGAHELVSLLGVSRARDLFALAMEAREHFLALIDREGIACDFRPGHLLTAAKPRDLDDLAREADCLSSVMGYDKATLLDAAATRAQVASTAFSGGLLDQGGGHVHPLNLCLGLADAAERAGARLCENSIVERITGSRVIAHAGHVEARDVILATDCWSSRLAPRLAAQHLPVMNYQIATAPLGEARARALIPHDVAISDTRFVVNYFRRTADHRILFGGGERYTPSPPSRPADFVRPYLAAIFPELAETPVDYVWGGGVSVTWTRFPALGRRGNIHYAHGYSGMGVILAPYAGKVLAEALCGDTRRFDALAALPRRNFPGGALLRHPLYVLGMLWYALRDRL